jgi:hypothetical protein
MSIRGVGEGVGAESLLSSLRYLRSQRRDINVLVAGG